MKFFLLIFVSFYLSACESLPKGVSPVTATWIQGIHALPSIATKSGSTESFNLSYKSPLGIKLSKKLLKPNVKIPAVIFMHGCAGFKFEEHTYQKLFLSHGYAVFMPDSFARPGRQALCGRGDMTARIDKRLLEVNYALKQIKKIPWVDHKRLVLSGFSEGGNTTDNWYNDDFAGLIVLGSACTHSMGSPAAPMNVPVLAIVGESDDYRPGVSCKIKRTIGGSKSIVIPKADHWIADHSVTQNSIKLFLTQCCSK